VTRVAVVVDRDALRGWGGLSPRYWAVALELQGERVLNASRALSEAPRGGGERPATLRRLHIEAHFLLVAMAHLLRSLEVSAEVVGGERIRAIRDDFKERAPWIKHFRDVLEHLDEYMSGGGRLRAWGELSPNAVPILGFDPLGRPWEVVVQLGQWRLPLLAAAEGGSRLGHMLAEAWEERFGPEPALVVWGRSA